MLSGEDLEGGYVSKTVGHAALKTIVGRPESGNNFYHHHGKSEDIRRSCVSASQPECWNELAVAPPSFNVVFFIT